MAVNYDVVLRALIAAAKAHGVHEREIGHADPEWPSWYAEHMVSTLTADGYELRERDR